MSRREQLTDKIQPGDWVRATYLGRHFEGEAWEDRTFGSTLVGGTILRHATGETPPGVVVHAVLPRLTVEASREEAVSVIQALFPSAPTPGEVVSTLERLGWARRE